MWIIGVMKGKTRANTKLSVSEDTLDQRFPYKESEERTDLRSLVLRTVFLDLGRLGLVLEPLIQGTARMPSS